MLVIDGPLSPHLCTEPFTSQLDTLTYSLDSPGGPNGWATPSSVPEDQLPEHRALQSHHSLHWANEVAEPALLVIRCRMASIMGITELL